MTAGETPIDPAFLSVSGKDGGGPRLLGSFSPRTGLFFFPRRRICPVCLEPVEDCELPTQGRLFAWTFLESDPFGGVGYGVGQIDLTEGPRIQGRLVGVPADWGIGMAMELATRPVFRDGAPWTDGEGRAYVDFCFRPVAAPA